MKKKLSLEKKRAIIGYSFISPWIIGLLVFFAVPIINSLLYSFQHVSVQSGGLSREFAGLTYYTKAFFNDEKFIPFLVDAVKNIFIEVPIIIIFSLFIAILLNQTFKGRSIVRSIFFLPLMLSSTVLLSIINGDAVAQGVSEASSVYLASSVSISDVLMQVGIPINIISYLTNIIDRIFNMTWQSGIQILLFLSALQGIPVSLHEAASVEGATSWEYFWKITIPMISPMIMVNILFTIIDTFTSYSNGVMRYIIDEANQLRYSYSSAMTWVYFVVICVVLGTVIGLISKKVYYSND